MRPKVVFDTNIFISAIIFVWNPRTCLELARQEKIDLYSSREIFFELAQKLKNKFDWNDEEVTELLQGLSRFIRVVNPKEKIFIIKNDPTDNKILECAKTEDLKYIVSGDIKHLLALGNFEKIKIVNAKGFLDMFYK